MIHKIDAVLSIRPARVVDADAVSNTNPNAAAAMWLPEPGNDPSKGEIFEDATNGIKVQVTEKTASGYKVQITVP